MLQRKFTIRWGFRFFDVEFDRKKKKKKFKEQKIYCLVWIYKFDFFWSSKSNSEFSHFCTVQSGPFDTRKWCWWSHYENWKIWRSRKCQFLTSQKTFRIELQSQYYWNSWFDASDWRRRILFSFWILFVSLCQILFTFWRLFWYVV